MEIVITNIVATGNLGQRMDLMRAAKLEHVRFDPNIYRCAYVKMPSMHSTVSVFSTGKMISAGTKSLKEARNDLRKAAYYLANEGLATKSDPGMKVQNIVLAGNFGHPLDIEHVHTTIGPSIYEPEQFPGVIHHPPQYPGVSILLFQSGKFVVAGVKSSQQKKVVELYLKTIKKRFIMKK